MGGPLTGSARIAPGTGDGAPSRGGLVVRFVTYRVTVRSGGTLWQVSVVVDATATDGVAAVAACLDAIETQSVAPNEVVLLVASANDAPSDRRARVVVPPGGAFVAALGATSGDLVAWIDADRVPAAGWLGALAGTVTSPATAVVLGRTIDALDGDLVTRWRATHRSRDLGDMPMVNPRGARGGNALVHRDRLGRLVDDAGATSDPVATLARRAPGFGLTVRHAPEAVARRTGSPGLAHEIARWCDEDGPGSDVERALDRGARAIRADLASGQPDLAYVSLLACLEVSRRAGIPPEAITRGLHRPGIVSDDVAQLIASDAGTVRPDGTAPDVSKRAMGAEASYVRWVDGLPRVGWSRLLGGRRAVALSLGWGPGPVVMGPVVPEAWWPRLWRVAAQVLPSVVPGLMSVVAVGRPGTPAGEAMYVVVTREVPDRDEIGSWSRHLDRATGVRCSLGAVASDALGWLPASRAVADAFADATCLWGAPDVVDVIPAFLPSAISRDEAFPVIDDAQVALDTGDASRARRLAVEALLVARGTYDPSAAARGRALEAAWPEVSEVLRGVPATVAVAYAQAEIHRWRFTWEGHGPGEAAIARWCELQSAWCPRRDPFLHAGDGGDA